MTHSESSQNQIKNPAVWNKIIYFKLYIILNGYMGSIKSKKLEIKN